jgi:hypothetical protein
MGINLVLIADMTEPSVCAVAPVAFQVVIVAGRVVMYADR